MTQATLFNAGEVRPTASLHRGDCLDVLRRMDDASVHAIVTDPPYGLSKEPDAAEVLAHWLAGDDYEHGGGGFMGKTWDSFVPDPYMGSGTTLVAAARLGFDSIGIDRDDDNEYLPIARMRLASIADITEGDAL